MRMWKKWALGMGLMLIGIVAITPFSMAKETRQLSVPQEDTDFKPLQEGGMRSGISENLNPWEIELDTSNDYEYPLEPDSTQTQPNLVPNSLDNNDTNNPRQRSETIPFIRF